MYRQGDVLILEASAAQKRQIHAEQAMAKVPRQAKRIVLAHGELTGHAHAIRAYDATLWQADGVRLLEVRRPVALEHEEHSRITIQPGTYEVRQQREWSEEASHVVAD